MPAFYQFSKKNFIRQHVFDLSLDKSSERTCTEFGIMPSFCKPCARRWRKRNCHFFGGKLRFEFPHKFIDDFFHDFNVERIKGNDTI